MKAVKTIQVTPTKVYVQTAEIKTDRRGVYLSFDDNADLQAKYNGVFLHSIENAIYELAVNGFGVIN